jgi:3-deoxy-D-manno-octulosonate 8-phosphate phosphatase (KDO 8-P phosphatase)
VPSKKNIKLVPKNFIIDVDGVFTDGKYYYTAEGKIMKQFGPDDHDALSLLSDKLYIHTITGDKRGFPITKKRIVDDMVLPLDLVSTFERVDWLKKRFNLNETIYMGDSIYDPLVFKAVAYSIAPANAFYKTKEAADFITHARGGEGAVAEACIHILEKFFHKSFNLEELDLSRGSGAWRKHEIHKKR